MLASDVPDCSKVPEVVLRSVVRITKTRRDSIRRAHAANGIKGGYVLIVLLSTIVIIVLPTAFSPPSLMPIDQFRQIARLLCHLHKFVLEQVPSRGSLWRKHQSRYWSEAKRKAYITRISRQTERDELLERLREVPLQSRRRVFRNQEEHLK